MIGYYITTRLTGNTVAVSRAVILPVAWRSQDLLIIVSENFVLLCLTILIMISQGYVPGWKIIVNMPYLEKKLVLQLKGNIFKVICKLSYLLICFSNMKNPRKFQTIKNLIGVSAHIEYAHGTDLDNQKYCSKEGRFYEFGSPALPVSDPFKQILNDLENGTSISDIARSYPGHFIRYWRGIKEMQKLVQLNKTSRSWKTEVYVYWGEPGTGKSRTALEEAKEKGGRIYYKQRGKWWDNYNGQENIIIDDFYGWIPYDELLRLLDRYPMQVEVKGGYEEMLAKHIWITSNVPIEEFYKFEGYQPNALRRRCTIIKHFI